MGWRYGRPMGTQNGQGATMSDEVIVEDAVTERGLRRVHLMRMGAKVDPVPWIDLLVPGESWDCLSLVERVDEIGMWHLHMAWNAREMVLVPPELEKQIGVSTVALWWPGKGVTAREAIDLAACLVKMKTGRVPGTAWMRKLPKGATETVETDAGTIRLQEAYWVPAKYVAVG